MDVAVRKAACQCFSEELKKVPDLYNQEDLVIRNRNFIVVVTRKLTRVSDSILDNARNFEDIVLRH